MNQEFRHPENHLLILSDRPWNRDLVTRLMHRIQFPISLISSPNKLTNNAIEVINPTWIFVAHWSHIIDKQIWSRWPTVIFHMTDLPYGRGGSPLQNLIKRGYSKTMLTALRCDGGLDTGDIYLKEPLSLDGSAEEIFLRADILIEKMIESIVFNTPLAKPQKGSPVKFTRRIPAQSNLSECSENSLMSWYDHIRMLDADGYPHAFLEAHGMRLEFRRVSQRSDGLYADVRITSITNQQSSENS